MHYLRAGADFAFPCFSSSKTDRYPLLLINNDKEQANRMATTVHCSMVFPGKVATKVILFLEQPPCKAQVTMDPVCMMHRAGFHEIQCLRSIHHSQNHLFVLMKTLAILPKSKFIGSMVTTTHKYTIITYRFQRQNSFYCEKWLYIVCVYPSMCSGTEFQTRVHNFPQFWTCQIEASKKEVGFGQPREGLRGME
ncbi:hypothetical protein SLE2022_154360 [Rubroshorea leprosula]